MPECGENDLLTDTAVVLYKSKIGSNKIVYCRVYALDYAGRFGKLLRKRGDEQAVHTWRTSSKTSMSRAVGQCEGTGGSNRDEEQSEMHRTSILLTFQLSE